MKLIIILAICLAILSAGCMEREESGGDGKDGVAGATGTGGPEKIKVTITSPGSGQIIQGDEEISFDGSAEGGEGDLSYEWSSSIDGKLSASRSFKYNPAELGKGEHIIILKATDESGNSGQGSVQVEVM